MRRCSTCSPTIWCGSRSPILSLDVLSEVALTPGQNLQLAVSQTKTAWSGCSGQGQGAGDVPIRSRCAHCGHRGAPVRCPGAARRDPDPLTPLERIAVSVASENAVTKQQSLAPLFANLGARTDNLPPALQQAMRGAGAADAPRPALDGGDIQNAFQKSGLFLEASLASGTIPVTACPT